MWGGATPGQRLGGSQQETRRARVGARHSTHPAVGGPGGKQYPLSREAGASIATQSEKNLTERGCFGNGMKYVSKGKGPIKGC